MTLCISVRADGEGVAHLATPELGFSIAGVKGDVRRSCENATLAIVCLRLPMSVCTSLTVAVRERPMTS